MSFKATNTAQSSSSAAFDQRRMLFGMVRSRGCVKAKCPGRGASDSQLWDMEGEMARQQPSLSHLHVPPRLGGTND